IPFLRELHTVAASTTSTSRRYSEWESTRPQAVQWTVQSRHVYGPHVVAERFCNPIACGRKSGGETCGRERPMVILECCTVTTALTVRANVGWHVVCYPTLNRQRVVR